MKIVCIGPGHPLRGGISNFNTALCRNLVKNGHDASIVSFSLQYPSFLFPGSTQFENGDPPEDIDIHPWINSINPFSWIRTAKRIRAAKPGLVVLHHWMPFIAVCMGFIVRRLGRVNPLPVIAVCHNVIPHEKQVGWKMLNRYLLKKCHGFVVLSRSVLDDLSLFSSSTHKVYVPHPVYDIFGESISRKEAGRYLGLDPGDEYLLFFGLVRKYKGLDLLLEAFAEVKDQRPKLNLIIAGEFYEGKDEYLEKISGLELNDRILLIDQFVPAGEVKYYFSLADLVVQPYRTATQSGISQIAYHFGVPMVVTDVGGLSEIVPDGKVGYVVPVDEKAIGKAISEFFNEGRSVEFRRNIQTERQRFSWDALNEQILALFDAINNSSQGKN